MPVLVVFSTFPTPDKAAEVVRTLVTEQLAACGNILGPVRSIYRWDDKVQDDTETLVLLKTTRERLDAMQARLVELHPYELPEVVALPVEGGHAPYLAWVASSTLS